ncbi:MAG: hypothetical protein EA424_15090 [Planctomycetaceae bacterium]|nr:MAG: hypothetical protein EA424_15090 [Planctomycetaceae bacterium]
MEQFSILCTTCQKRLNVRDTSAIGEILICPKCGSMVLVSPPEGANPHAADEDCDTVDEIQPPDLPELSLPAGLPLDQRPDALTDEPTAEPPRAPKPKPSTPVETGTPPATTPVPPDAAVGAEATEPTAPPLLPDDHWVSQATEDRRQWLMIGGAAMLGISLSILLVGFWASRTGDLATRTDPPPDAPPSPVAPKDVPDDQPEDQPEDPFDGQPEDKPSDTTGDAAVEQPETADSPGELAEDPSDAADADQRQEPGTTEPVDPAMNEETERSQIADPDAVQQTEPVVPDVGERQIDDQDLTEDSPPTRVLPSFAPFIQDQPYQVDASQEGLENGEPMPDMEHWEDASDDGSSMPRPEPRQVNIPERLQDTIPAVDIPGMPLIAFTHMVTGLSTIPISLDPDALALLRLRPDSPVKVQATNTQVGDMLVAAIRPLGLGYLHDQDQLLITRIAPADNPLRRVRHPVGDLVQDSEDQLDRLADWIMTMVEPDSWEVQGGAGELVTELPDLVIRHQDTVLLRALLFCERLRVARGLSPTTNLDPQLMRLDLRCQRADTLLQERIRIRYDQPVPMLQILQQITRDTGLQILVDWHALGQMGWTPAAEITLVADDVPLGQALMDLLGPMDLTFRTIDASTVQVTSPEADRARWDIEFHPLEGLLAAPSEIDLWMQQLEEAMRQARLDEADGVFRYDPISRHLIAAFSPSHQRWLADLLARWETGEP